MMDASEVCGLKQESYIKEIYGKDAFSVIHEPLNKLQPWIQYSLCLQSQEVFRRLLKIEDFFLINGRRSLGGSESVFSC